MSEYSSMGEILLDLSKVEHHQAAGRGLEAAKLWAKLHLDDEAGRIEAFCKAFYGEYSVKTANKLCGQVCNHDLNDLSDYEAKRLPPREFMRLAKELPVLVRSATVAPEAIAAEPFVPTPLQRAILDALDGQSLKKEPLAAKVCGGDASRLYKSGGLAELRSGGMVRA